VGEWPQGGVPDDDDRTRPVRSPGRGTPPRPAGPGALGAPATGLASGQPAYTAPGGSGRRAGGSGLQDGDGPRAVSRVYGKERSGSAPVRPLPGSGRWSGDEPPGRPPRVRRKRRWGRIIGLGLAALLVILLVAGVAGYFAIDGRLTRIEALVDYEGRPADTPGQNWLLVGSDSRKGLSAAQRRKLATGRAAGQRTDTMMLLHIPDGEGRPTLVSLPRDSYVPIPGNGRNKLNAAYAFGGPQLLTRTVETVTGLRIDNYMEIGFAGFVGIVDAVGGVNICVKQPIKDPKAGIDLKKGCQEMDGGTALGYVRTRATARADLDRVVRQRQFFSAVVKKVADPGVLLNPFTSVPLAFAATDSVSVDTGTGAFNLLSLGLAMGDGPITTTVPVAGTPTLPGVGSVVQWDRDKAVRLFDALAADQAVPKDLLEKT
jgi:LCP family protein required for cell wall assembly